MPRITRAQSDEIYLYAMAALACEQIGDRPSANEYCRHVLTSVGPVGVVSMLIAWGDALKYATAPPGGIPEGATIMPLFKTEDGTGYRLADDVAPVSAWAGRVVTAILAEDIGQFKALCSSIPDDQGQEYVSAVLEVCASGMLRSAEVREFATTANLEDLGL